MARQGANGGELRRERRARERAERKAQEKRARERRPAEGWFAELTETEERRAYHAFLAAKRYGLTPEEGLARLRRDLEAACGGRRLTRDEVIAAVAANEGMTAEEIMRLNAEDRAEFAALRRASGGGTA